MRECTLEIASLDKELTGTTDNAKVTQLRVRCACERCQVLHDVGALSRLLESLSPTDARPVRVVLSEEIVRLRERVGAE